MTDNQIHPDEWPLAKNTRKTYDDDDLDYHNMMTCITIIIITTIITIMTMRYGSAGGLTSNCTQTNGLSRNMIHATTQDDDDDDDDDYNETTIFIIG